MHLFHFGKYRAIVISIGVFVLLVAGTMAMNFVISSRLVGDAVVINLAGGQRMLSQRTVKNLFDLQHTARDGGSIDHPLSELAKTVTLFDTTLQALLYGGPVTGSDGRPVRLEKVEVMAGRLLLEEALKLWLPYKQSLDSIIRNKPHADWFTNLAKVTDYSQRNNLALLDLMHGLTTDLQTTADTLSVDLASRQEVLSQRLVKEIFALKEAAIAGADITGSLKALQHTATLFDTTLMALHSHSAPFSALLKPF